MKEFFSLLVRNRLFWIGVFVRCVMMPNGSSYYLTDLFLPFIDRSIQNLGINPWMIANPGEFPYGSVLYAVIMPFKYLGYVLFGTASLGETMLSRVLFKIPLFIADLGMLAALFRLSGRKLDRLAIFYWLNPVLIIITYGVTQLDVVCMTFLMWSLVFLVDKRVLTSSFLFGFALLCKFHVILLIPFLMAYIWNNYFRSDAIARIFAWISFVLMVGVLGFAPLLMTGSAGYASAGSPEAQRIFGMALRLGENQVFYIGIFAILLVMGRLCFSTKINASGLIYGSGALMTTLVLTVNPTAGWYFWFLPFVALLYTQYLSLPRLLMVGFVINYFLFFEVSNSNTNLVLNGIFLTSLQTFTACFLIAFFIYVIKHDAPILRRLRPFMIGIGGDSGAGKNHMSDSIRMLFGTSSTRTVDGDDYHKWERGNANWKSVTHLDPLANNLDLLLNHSVAMRRGQSVESRHYDHSTGKFTEAREVSPAKLIIFQGLHALYGQVFRETMDLKIFLKPTDAVRKAWKVNRDVKERGHEEQKVLKSMEDRKPDSEKHIDPQAEQADWLISYDTQGDGYVVHHRLRNNPSVHNFLNELQQIGCQVSAQEINDDLLKVSISGEPEVTQVKQFAETHFLSLRQLLRSSNPPVWKKGLDGVNQLVLLFLLAIGSEETSWH